MRPVLLVAAASILGFSPAAWANVVLMAGQQAQPLGGSFNSVPVLHSNQPEEVAGPGILVSTSSGEGLAENGQSLAHATYTFNGDFGLHAHHKYFPSDSARMGYGGQRGQLTLAAIAINPGDRDVTLRFERGSVKNSFEAPYLATNLMGVIPQGTRPWNTGPGAATAVQMLRGGLDRKLPEQVRLPAHSRVVLFSTELPARGIANALLKGRSDGPFQLAVVAAQDPRGDGDILRVLDEGRFAPGRTYLGRLDQINNRTVFSRVGGVAIGDTYQATVQHNLQSSPLHVPLTTTNRHHFGTGESQVNPLVSRMVDSSLDNIGTYGVRYDVDLNLTGSGPYQLVLSHPTLVGRQFTAFRGTIGITTDKGYEELHVGMRSGQSLALKSLELSPERPSRVRVSLVYPADATPGHLLSVVPDQQMARLREQENRLETARKAAAAAPMLVVNPPMPEGLPAAQSPQIRPTATAISRKPVSPQNKPASDRVTSRGPKLGPPLTAPPPVMPSSGWPPSSPAMLDPTRPYQLMRNWFYR
jgi:hypothetical protein